MTDAAWGHSWHRRVYRALWLLTILAGVGLATALAALAALRPAITEQLQRGSGEAFFRRAVSQIEQGNDEEVTRLLASALEAGFRDDDAAAKCGDMLGDRLVRQERYAEALAAYAHVPEGWRNHASQFSGYARALLETDQLEELERAATRWLQMGESENNLTQQIAAHTTLATVATRLGRSEEAESHLAKAAALRAERAEQ